MRGEQTISGVRYVEGGRVEYKGAKGTVFRVTVFDGVRSIAVAWDNAPKHGVGVFMEGDKSLAYLRVE